MCDSGHCRSSLHWNTSTTRESSAGHSPHSHTHTHTHTHTHAQHTHTHTHAQHRDLNPDNILLDMSGNHTHTNYCSQTNPNPVRKLTSPLSLSLSQGNALLTYYGKWDYVEWEGRADLAHRLYTAPGMTSMAPGMTSMAPGMTSITIGFHLNSAFRF